LQEEDPRKRGALWATAMTVASRFKESRC